MFGWLKQHKSTTQGTLKADNGSLVVGGNIRDSNISIGITAGELEVGILSVIHERLDKITEQVSKDKASTKVH
jgi:hypothetical protein